MTIQTWWLYAVAVFVVSATPGPNMLHVMTRSIAVGPRKALATMAGCMSAILLCLVASAAGLGALLKAEPRLFDALRYAGVAYLIYLGIRAWRAPVGAPAADGGTRIAPSPIALYRAGLLTGLSNPKLIVFAGALFPQFIRTDAPFAPQLTILVVTFVLIESLWYAIYALGGSKLARWLEPAHRQRLFNRATGAIFVGFGGLLLGSRV
jgi:threonine/homoserine/homoserine lactone efflux protein